MRNQQLEFERLEADRFMVKRRIWLFGTSAWIVGIIDRSIAIFSEQNFSLLNLVQLLLAVGFFIGWLYLKPSISSQRTVQAATLHRDSTKSSVDYQSSADRHLFEQSMYGELSFSEFSESSVEEETLVGKSDES
jgi:hypothetical protein